MSFFFVYPWTRTVIESLVCWMRSLTWTMEDKEQMISWLATIDDQLICYSVRNYSVTSAILQQNIRKTEKECWREHNKAWNHSFAINVYIPSQLHSSSISLITSSSNLSPNISWTLSVIRVSSFGFLVLTCSPDGRFLVCLDIFSTCVLESYTTLWNNFV